MLIHGFWVTPRSWEHWIAHYEAKGFRVLAPAYPGFEVEVEALNADPSPIEAVTVPQIIEHLEAVVGGLDVAADPDRPLGRRRVHPDPARPRLRRRRAWRSTPRRPRASSACRCRRSRRRSRCSRTPPTATAPSASRHEQWHYAFTNGVQRGGVARAVRALPRSPRPARSSGAARSPTSTPATTTATSNYKQRRPRAAAVHLRQRRPPDAAVAPALQRQALQVRAHAHRGQGVRGAAPAPRQEGWEEVADYALEWALEHARTGAPQSA